MLSNIFSKRILRFKSVYRRCSSKNNIDNTVELLENPTKPKFYHDGELMGLCCGFVFGSKLVYNQINYAEEQPTIFFNFVVVTLFSMVGDFVGWFIGPVILPITIASIGLDIYQKNKTKDNS